MSPPKIRCRQIKTADLGAIADLLAQGFPLRTRNYWTKGLARLSAHPTPEGCPEFGYLLEADGAVVGAILLISSRAEGDADGAVRCNVSSWYVEPAFRGYATLLVNAALKHKQVTYVNTSAAEHTWPILKAQGFQRYSQGQFAALPVLSLAGSRVRARPFSGGEADRALPEFELLSAHVAAGCLAVVCETADGPLPFVFARRRIAGFPLGVVQLVYCRDTGGFARCAGPLGRLLLAQGVACVLCDAEAPMGGLVGRFFRDKGSRYFRGPARPRLNDLSFTEQVLFGA